MLSPPLDTQQNARKTVYYAAFVASLVVFAGIGFALARVLTAQGYDLWEWRINPYFVLVFSWGYAKRIAVWVCQQMGLSLAGTFIETIQRTTSQAAGNSPLVPLRFSRGVTALILPVCCTLLALIFLSYLLEERALLSYVIRVPLILLAGTVAVLCWKNISKPEVQADDGGVSACDSLRLVYKSVRWEQIESCDFVTVRDVFGKVTDQYPVVKDAHDKTLVRLKITSQLTEQAQETRDRLEQLLSLKLTGGAKRSLSSSSSS